MALKPESAARLEPAKIVTECGERRALTSYEEAVNQIGWVSFAQNHLHQIPEPFHIQRAGVLLAG